MPNHAPVPKTDPMLCVVDCAKGAISGFNVGSGNPADKTAVPLESKKGATVNQHAETFISQTFQVRFEFNFQPIFRLSRLLGNYNLYSWNEDSLL